jgi:hypothetical protein
MPSLDSPGPALSRLEYLFLSFHYRPVLITRKVGYALWDMPCPYCKHHAVWTYIGSRLQSRFTCLYKDRQTKLPVTDKCERGGDDLNFVIAHYRWSYARARAFLENDIYPGYAKVKPNQWLILNTDWSRRIVVSTDWSGREEEDNTIYLDQERKAALHEYTYLLPPQCFCYPGTNANRRRRAKAKYREDRRAQGFDC